MNGKNFRMRRKRMTELMISGVKELANIFATFSAIDDAKFAKVNFEQEFVNELVVINKRYI